MDSCYNYSYYIRTTRNTHCVECLTRYSLVAKYSMVSEVKRWRSKQTKHGPYAVHARKQVRKPRNDACRNSVSKLIHEDIWPSY